MPAYWPTLLGANEFDHRGVVIDVKKVASILMVMPSFLPDVGVGIGAVCVPWSMMGQMAPVVTNKCDHGPQL